MPTDPFAEEKKGLRAKDPKQFISAVNHLLLQRQPALTDAVRAVEPRIWEVALAPSPEPKKRLGAIAALVKLGSDVTRLAPLLTEKSTELVRDVAMALGGKVVAPEAVTKLLSKLEKEGDWSPQYDALRALRYFDDPRVVPAHLKALKHEQGAVCREALKGLGHLGAPEGVEHFIAFQKSTNPQLLTAAAAGLSTASGAKAKAALRDKKAYAHAKRRAHDAVDGRFATAALRYYELESVDDDLLELTSSADGEVAESAIQGLVHRRCQRAVVDLATQMGSARGAERAGSFFSLFQGLATSVAPEPKVAKALVAVLDKVKPSVLDELRVDTEQHRYAYERLGAENLEFLDAWRKALAVAKKNKALIQALLKSD